MWYFQCLQKTIQVEIDNGLYRQNVFGKDTLFFKPFTPTKIRKLIKCLDTNKIARIDTISSKLTKIAAGFLTLLIF